MVEKKNVVIEGTIVSDGGPSKVTEPKKVVKSTPKTTKKEATKNSAVASGRSVYSTLNYKELMSEVKARGLEFEAKGLTDSEKGRRTLRNILKNDDAEKKVKPHLLSETKTSKTEETEFIPWWAWVIIVITIILVAVLSRPRQPVVNLSPIQGSVNQLSTKVDSLDQSVTDLSGRIAALEKVSSVESEKTVVPVTDPENVYTNFGQLGTFYRNIDEEVTNFHSLGRMMEYECKDGEIGVYISIDKANTVMGVANEHEVVAYVPCQDTGVITASTIHYGGEPGAEFQRAHFVVLTKELPITPLDALMLLKAEEQNRKALLFDGTGNLVETYPAK